MWVTVKGVEERIRADIPMPCVCLGPDSSFVPGAPYFSTLAIVVRRDNLQGVGSEAWVMGWVMGWV